MLWLRAIARLPTGQASRYCSCAHATGCRPNGRTIARSPVPWFGALGGGSRSNGMVCFSSWNSSMHKSTAAGRKTMRMTPGSEFQFCANPLAATVRNYRAGEKTVLSREGPDVPESSGCRRYKCYSESFLTLVAFPTVRRDHSGRDVSGVPLIASEWK